MVRPPHLRLVVLVAVGGLAASPAVGHALETPTPPTLPLPLPGLPAVPTPAVPVPIEPVPVPAAPTPAPASSAPADPAPAPSQAPAADRVPAAPQSTAPVAPATRDRRPKLRTVGQSTDAAVATTADNAKPRPLRSVVPVRATATSVPHPRRGVLGATVSDVAESLARLHPAFFLLLGVAIVLLGIASVPSTAIPHPTAAAAVAGRRIELTLAGVVGLTVVVVAYLSVLA